MLKNQKNFISEKIKYLGGSNELPYKKMEWKSSKGLSVRVKCIGLDDSKL